MKDKLRNLLVNLLTNERGPILIVVLLWNAIVQYDIMVYGTDGKGAQRYKYRTDKNGVRWVKKKGLKYFFQKWEKYPDQQFGCLDIASLYPNTIY